jgi:hypothetical protein
MNLYLAIFLNLLFFIGQHHSLLHPQSTYFRLNPFGFEIARNYYCSYNMEEDKKDETEEYASGSIAGCYAQPPNTHVRNH